MLNIIHSLKFHASLSPVQQFFRHVTYCKKPANDESKNRAKNQVVGRYRLLGRCIISCAKSKTLKIWFEFFFHTTTLLESIFPFTEKYFYLRIEIGRYKCTVGVQSTFNHKKVGIQVRTLKRNLPTYLGT